MRVITSTAGVAAAAAILLSTGYALSAVDAARPASGASAAGPGGGSGEGTGRAAGAVSASSAPAAHDTIRAASTSTTSTGFSAKAPARCRTTGLRARVGRQDPGAGNRYAPLVLTNTSGRTCWVYGFVGLVLIDGRGDVLRTRTRRESVTPHRVTLRPGASAHARLHWTVVPTDHETRCPASARLMIIPPDEVAHLEVPFSATICDDGRIDARPMAPGAGL
ncbi:DUF4232 domain-containing protein [Microbispora cellulosiformans]|uniref:DUF4232 domain-containing protein n=1 Tax=Microbispora cellulosiformans TaxID=2614688 RepID=A0A5J5JRM6_9ACTN|nr:DUF4232 domain-containing protein [Microbispora cellulosiformans]KAA9373423.1 DUF4232 domain-containing protein [Microbispora cellulosiformans]